MVNYGSLICVGLLLHMFVFLDKLEIKCFTFNKMNSNVYFLINLNQ